jgi:hypothetical protein
LQQLLLEHLIRNGPANLESRPAFAGGVGRQVKVSAHDPPLALDARRQSRGRPAKHTYRSHWYVNVIFHVVIEAMNGTTHPKFNQSIACHQRAAHVKPVRE